MGNWIGRAGRGVQSWTNYYLSPRTKIQLQYRLQEVSKDFLGGGRLVDYSAGGDVMLSHLLSMSGYVQYEQWRFPVLSTSRQSDITSVVQLIFHPRLRVRK